MGTAVWGFCLGLCSTSSWKIRLTAFPGVRQLSWSSVLSPGPPPESGWPPQHGNPCSHAQAQEALPIVSAEQAPCWAWLGAEHGIQLSVEVTNFFNQTYHDSCLCPDKPCHPLCPLGSSAFVCSPLPLPSSHLLLSLCLQGHSQGILWKIPNSNEMVSTECLFSSLSCLWKGLLVCSCQVRPYSMVVKYLASGPLLSMFKSQLLHCQPDV